MGLFGSIGKIVKKAALPASALSKTLGKTSAGRTILSGVSRLPGAAGTAGKVAKAIWGNPLSRAAVSTVGAGVAYELGSRAVGKVLDPDDPDAMFFRRRRRRRRGISGADVRTTKRTLKTINKLYNMMPKRRSSSSAPAWRRRR